MVSNPFDIFQTETATLKKVSLNGAGDETVDDSFSVEIDPVFGWSRTFSQENEETDGQSTIISGDNLESNWDESHRRWKLDYKGHEYMVENPTPIYTPGTNTIEHIEITLT